MKKQILLVVLFISTIAAQGQGIRNSILGLYNGTYQSYDNWPNDPPVIAGVKITAHPTDTSGMVFNDTINNIIDTLFITLTYSIPEMVSDTMINDCCHNLPGDYYPAKDSIVLSYYLNHTDINPTGEFVLKCVYHDFPTWVDEWTKPNFSIYPNPVIDKLHINLSGDKSNTYSILNIYGQLVDTGIISTSIDISTFPPGLYYLQFNKNRTVKTFIKN